MKRISMLVCLVLVLAVVGAAFAETTPRAEWARAGQLVIPSVEHAGIFLHLEDYFLINNLAKIGDEVAWNRITSKLHKEGLIGGARPGEQYVVRQGPTDDPKGGWFYMIVSPVNDPELKFFGMPSQWKVDLTPDEKRMIDEGVQEAKRGIAEIDRRHKALKEAEERRKGSH